MMGALCRASLKSKNSVSFSDHYKRPQGYSASKGREELQRQSKPKKTAAPAAENCSASKRGVEAPGEGRDARAPADRFCRARRPPRPESHMNWRKRNLRLLPINHLFAAKVSAAEGGRCPPLAHVRDI